MTDSNPDELVSAVAGELRGLARVGATPAQAVAQMRSRFGARVNLVHARDATGHQQFDAVIDEPDGAVVVRYCPDRGVPFMLRAAERLTDRELVRVDGQALPVGHAIALIDFIWTERPVMQRLVDVGIIEAALRAEPIGLTDDQVQAALDRIRLANGLFGATETRRWMAERSLTHEALEAHARDQAAIRALRDRVVGGRITSHFAAHRAEYDAATLVRVALRDDACHRGLVERIVADCSGLDAALGVMADAGVLPRAEPSIVRIRRGELGEALRAVVFEREPRRFHAIRDGDRLVVVHVLATHPAVLDDDTAERIAVELFDDWLTERRAAACIEWNWGPADRTTGAAAPPAR